jgi:hypothetical protein
MATALLEFAAGAGFVSSKALRTPETARSQAVVFKVRIAQAVSLSSGGY